MKKACPDTQIYGNSNPLFKWVSILALSVQTIWSAGLYTFGNIFVAFCTGVGCTYHHDIIGGTAAMATGSDKVYICIYFSCVWFFVINHPCLAYYFFLSTTFDTKISVQLCKMATVPALIIYLHTRMRTEKHTYRFVHNHRHWNRKAVTPIITNSSIAATIPTVSIIVMSSPLAPEDKSLKLSKFQVVHNEGHDYNLLDLMDFFQIAASFSRWWTMVLTLIMVVTMIIL